MKNQSVTAETSGTSEPVEMTVEGNSSSESPVDTGLVCKQSGCGKPILRCETSFARTGAMTEDAEYDVVKGEWVVKQNDDGDNENMEGTGWCEDGHETDIEYDEYSELDCRYADEGK